MKRKGLIFFILLLSIICFAAAALGYRESKKEENNDINNEVVIKYVYYLDNEKVDEKAISNKKEIFDEITSSTTSVLNDEIVFSNYSCTNNLTGTFNTDSWEFIPNEDKSSTCNLYFNKAYYDVTLTLTNAELDNNQSKRVKRETNGQFKIKPNEGYEYDSLNCSNNKEAEFDKDNSILTINAITEDVSCKVVFKIKKLKFEVKVENGSGDNSLTAEYGTKVTSLAVPNSGYELASDNNITCTNKQSAKYQNSSIIIDKLTDDTVCTIKFSQIKIEKFKVTLNMPEHVKVTKGGTSQEVDKGSDVEFTLEATTGYEIDKMDCDGTEPAKTLGSNNTVTYKINSVSKNLTCTVTEKQVLENN